MKSGRRTRLGIVGKLMLFSIPVLTIIPWFAQSFIFNFIEEQVLEAQQQALLLTTQAVAAVLHGQDDLFADAGGLPFSDSDAQSCSPPFVKNRINLSETNDEWSSFSHGKCRYSTIPTSGHLGSDLIPGLSGKLRLAQRNGDLYAFFKITDEAVIYRGRQHAKLGTGDHIRFEVAGEDQTIRRFVVVAQRAGSASIFETEDDWLKAIEPGFTIPRIKAEWHETDDGYLIRLRIPLDMLPSKKIRFIVADKNLSSSKNAKSFFYFETSSKSQNEFIHLIFLENPEIERIIQGVDLPGAKISVVDRNNRIRIEHGETLTRIASSSPTRKEFMKNSPGDEGTTTGSTDSITWAKYPIRISSGSSALGYVLIEQRNHHILSDIRDKLKQLWRAAIFIGLVVAIAFWLFASRLAWRIRRLSIRADATIDDDGRVLSDNIGTELSAGDEIGNLSRTISGLLSRLMRHEGFLKRIPRALRHELNNPLNSVSTSLQVLTSEYADVAGSKYVKSAERGIARINEIIETFADAASMEEALHSDDQEEIDLAHLLENYVTNIAASLPEHRLSFLITNSPVLVSGSGSRIEQLLDKLTDNAAEFAPPNGEIIFEIEKRGEGEALLTVSNDGPQIPEHELEHLFDSMYSTRSSGQPHLGMGLYIARLIVEHMQGKIMSKNRNNESGVTFVISLPLI